MEIFKNLMIPDEMVIVTTGAMMVDGSLMVLKGWAWAVLLTDYLHSPSSVVDFYLTALLLLLRRRLLLQFRKSW